MTTKTHSQLVTRSKETWYEALLTETVIAKAIGENILP